MEMSRELGRGGDALRATGQDLLKSSLLLFDFTHHNVMAMIKIAKDRSFLLDQRKE